MIAKEGANYLLDTLRAGWLENGLSCVIGLYGTDFTPSRSNTAAGQASKEASFSGYTRFTKSASNFGAPFLLGEKVFLRTTICEGNYSAISTATTIYGWFMLINPSSTPILIGEKKYTTPIVLGPGPAHIAFFPVLAIAQDPT